MKPISPFTRRRRARSRNVTTAESAGETDRFCLAWSTVVQSLTSMQLRQCAEDLANVLSRVDLTGRAVPEISLEELRPSELAAILPDFARACIPGKCTVRPLSLDRRIQWVGEMLNLSEADCRILALFTRVSLFEEWQALADVIPGTRGSHLSPRAIAALIGDTAYNVSRRLEDGSALLTVGLLDRDGDGEFSSGNFLLRIARSAATNRLQMKRQMLPRPASSSLEWHEFEHLGPQRDIAKRLLSSGNGGSILLYGPPGTGKTEFAKMLAREVGAKAVFAGEADEEGREPTRRDRLSHLLLLRALTRKDEGLLVVMDEADDVLLLEREDRGQRSKVWLNRIVEESERPIVWIINEASLLEPSIVRRMDLAIEFPRPTRAQRLRIVRRQAQRHRLAADDDALRRLAALPTTPAVLESAVRGARRSRGDAIVAETICEGLITALAGRPPSPVRLPAAYDPSLAVADADLSKLSERLAGSSSRGWSLLLSGPSGTGKSAYAHHLAERMGIEVMERRGSDLFGMYVGETEARMAAAFRDAAKAGALLLIDEADDFLFDRNLAVRSWERGMVNEMLRQMEALQAPFVATTNAADRLDPATQRRFTLRAKFGPLDEPRAADLFVRWFGQAVPAHIGPLIDQTPGDFAVVAARAQILGENNGSTLARWLREEANTRTGCRGKLGF